MSAETGAAGPAAIAHGARIGRYVVERAGHHAGRAVCRARDAALDRPVVLELYPGHDEATERLFGEARALARLAHPNVVTVLEAGEHEGSVFVAFEHEGGEPAGSWLGSGPRRVAEIVHVFREAALGLAAAHEVGLVHGHLATDCILVGPGGRVRVDFALARRAGAPAGDATPAGDQSSLAALLRDALARRGRVPARVSRAVDRALAADPARRWPSMADLARALDLSHRRVGLVVAASLALAALCAGAVALSVRQLADDPEEPCAWVPRALAGVWDEPRRARVLGSFERAGPDVAASATSTLRALDRYGRSWLEQRASLCRATAAAGADAERRSALTGICLSRRRDMLGALVTALGAADADRLRNAVEAAASLPPVEECAHSQHLVVQASVPAPTSIGRVAELTAELDRLDARRLLGDLAVAGRVREIAAEASRLGAHSLASSAWMTVGLADREAATSAEELESLRESVWAAEAAGDLVAILMGWIRLVEVASNAAVPEHEIESMLGHAQATLARIARIDAAVADRYRADLLTAQADFFDAYGSAEQAEAVQRQAIALLTRTARGESTLELAAAEHGLGQILIGAARYDEAVEVSTRALSRTRQLVGDDHPNTMVRHFQLGWALFMRGRHEPALAEVAACRRIARRIGAVVYVAKAAILEAQIEQKRDRPQAARAALEGAIADGSAAALSEFQVRFYLGEVHINLRDYAAAEREYRRALDAQLAVNPDHPDADFARAGVGMALLERGRPREALPYLATAVEHMAPRKHSERPLAEMRRLLADALWATGQRARAREIAGQVRTFLASLPPDLAGEELADIDRWLASHRTRASSRRPRRSAERRERCRPRRRRPRQG